MIVEAGLLASIQENTLEIFKQNYQSLQIIIFRVFLILIRVCVWGCEILIAHG